jgi:hypothetical protein
MPAALGERAVFINCPFDAAYQPMFEAIVFTVQRCGFVARCALEVSDGGETRIARILTLIGECPYGIHDISRTELDATTNLPRFNMPFELGLYLGARHFGGRRQRAKRCLILDRERYRYQTFLSDIAGQDIEAHGGDREHAVARVRNFLRADPDQGTLPSGRVIWRDLARFERDKPAICAEIELDAEDLSFPDLRHVIGLWLEEAA